MIGNTRKLVGLIMPKIRQVHEKRNFADPLNIKMLPVSINKTKTTTTTTMSFFVVIIGLIIWPMLVADAGKPPPPPVTVNKCCRIGETLDRNQECSFGGAGVDHWWPVIYLLGKSIYFTPHGEAPRFFRVNESSRPRCKSGEALELVTGNHTMAVFSNGTLYLPSRQAVLESDNFCVDKDVALICSPQIQNADFINQPINRTLVRKCCPQKAIYQTNSDTTCVTLHDGHEIIGRKLIENSTNQLEYRYGFPQCKTNSNNFAIIGKFNESKFDESTGHLMLAEGVFQLDQYCLEHFNDTGTVNVHVFTCTDYLPTSEKKVSYN